MPSQPAPMHTPELKLCPFCKRLPERTGHMLQTGESVFWCGCLIAYCETVVGVTADRWNQRAPSPGEAALLAALQDADKAFHKFAIAAQTAKFSSELALTCSEDIANEYVQELKRRSAEAEQEEKNALEKVQEVFASARAALSAAQSNEREGL